jgi:cobalt-zinc-cadmium efflux system membrane fusion protein
VMLDVTEFDMGLLQPGQELRVRSRALPDRVFAGHLATVGQSLDPATRTVRARGSVDNPALLLKAEMYVDVQLDAAQTDGTTFAIASTAVFMKNGKAYVFVETAPGSFERRAVEPGAESAGKILVRRGLQANERVLVEGSLLVEAALEAGGKS